MTEPSRARQVADYLLTTTIGDTEAAWKAELTEIIVARWPDITEAELTAAFLMAMTDTTTEIARETGRRLREARGR